MSNVVAVNRLTKSYGSFKAVDDVSFVIEENRIYGLLGRNGAGKTTIMHMITAQLFPSGGELKVFGEAPFENNRVLSRLCFIKESQKYPDMFQIADVLATAETFFPNWDRPYALSRMYIFFPLMFLTFAVASLFITKYERWDDIGRWVEGNVHTVSDVAPWLLPLHSAVHVGILRIASKIDRLTALTGRVILAYDYADLFMLSVMGKREGEASHG